MNQVNRGLCLIRSLIAGLLTTVTVRTNSRFSLSVQATPLSNDYCHFSSQDSTEKEQLRQSTIKGSKNAQIEYNEILVRHARLLSECRSQSWLHNQAIWLRLYPCDSLEGRIDEILDRLVNKGYNQIYLGVFYNGLVLLPKNDNSTTWPSILDSPNKENKDLLAEIIKKAHLRGVKVYAWMFSLNYGYLYGQRNDRQMAIARNGKGENSLAFLAQQSQLFIDPYNEQARQDYSELLRLILQRRPDGVLFDYIRYPRGEGNQSAVGDVKDLWIYSEASLSVLLNRARNNKGHFLIERFLNQGYIVPNDLLEADQLYRQEASPLWQGRTPADKEMSEPLNERYERIKEEIWYLTVAHAAQGILDFLNFANEQVKRQGIAVGSVFFPDGNQPVGQRGFDSRLQPWDRFPETIEWHAMSYALCDQPECILRQVQKVLSAATPNQTKVVPALAGFWGKNSENRPSLETQMSALHSNFPQLNSISHFSFSWQEPEFDSQRKFCKD